MARTVVGYIKQFLNTSASPSYSASVEAVTGLPIATGINVGAFEEFSDGDAAQYSSKGVNTVSILTAGSGQTPGTYTANASTGGAVIQYVIAAGGTMTAAPTVLVSGNYPTGVAPTFTIAAGGTPATVAAAVGLLYGGTYLWAQLDPAITTPVPVGSALYWLAGSGHIVTTINSTTTNFPDFAGVSIDPGFGALNANGQLNTYAFVQLNGKATILVGGTAFTAFGTAVGITAAQSYFALQASPTPLNSVGYTLQTAIPVGGLGVARIVRPVVRF
jgi:hypothetical protein